MPGTRVEGEGFSRFSNHLEIKQGDAERAQGHSKNLSCDEGDRLGAILAEVFASLAHGQAAGSDEVEDEIADRGERAGAGANATAILVHRHVTNVMQAVFDAPVGAGEMKEPLWPGLCRGQAGDQVGDLGADLVADAALPRDAGNLGGARPCKVRDDFGADRDAARLNAAVPLLDGSGGGEIRRRSGGGAGR